MAIMELPLSLKRSISLLNFVQSATGGQATKGWKIREKCHVSRTLRNRTSLIAILLIFLALPGCEEKKKPQPLAQPKAENTVVPQEPAKKPDTVVPPEKVAPEQEKTPTADQSPTTEKTPSIPFEGKPTVTPPEEKKSEDAATEKKTGDENENAEEAEKTVEEIRAEVAERRKATLKTIIDRLGPPLVEDSEKLTKAHPLFPVWVDKQNKRIVLQGVICQTNAPLEMFAVQSGTKEHEAIVSIPTEAFIVHAALLAIGAKPGKPAEFGPKPEDYKPARGTEVEILVQWKNDKGELQNARAQEWIKNVKTGKDLDRNWVFGGSGFWKDEQTGVEYYKAEGGDFICVSNFPDAMLDLPVESSQMNDALLFQANAERVPPLDTPVTVILVPKIVTE
jgi:hypothetical protein